VTDALQPVTPAAVSVETSGLVSSLPECTVPCQFSSVQTEGRLGLLCHWLESRQSSDSLHMITLAVWVQSPGHSAFTSDKISLTL
jgi:hypothetical protein